MTMRSSRAHLVHLLASLTYLQACSRTHKVFSAVEQRAPTSPTSARTRVQGVSVWRLRRPRRFSGKADSSIRPQARCLALRSELLAVDFCISQSPNLD